MLVVLAAKTAIAEPFYVPSGSMEPTLLIGDELLATKYPYGYSTASLPAFHRFAADTARILGALAASAATSSCSAGRATARRSGSSA